MKLICMRAVCCFDMYKDTVFLFILCDDGTFFVKVYGVLTKVLQKVRVTVWNRLR